MDLDALFKRLKPHLAASSIRNYRISLERLALELLGSRQIDSLDFLKDHPTILKALSTKTPTTLRNYLNSLIVALQHFEDYESLPAWQAYSKKRDQINNDLRQYAESGKKTARQEANWISQEEFDKVVEWYEKYLRKHKVLQSPPSEIDRTEMNRLQDYVLLKLYEQIPSRNDFATVRVVTQSEYNAMKGSDLTTNFLVLARGGMYFVVQSWKTKKGPTDRRRIDVPHSLQKLIRAYIRKRQDPQYLFYDTQNNILNRNGLTKMFTRIFKQFFPERNVGSSMLRHLFLTSKYGTVKKEMDKDAELLAHSGATQKTYIKDD